MAVPINSSSEFDALLEALADDIIQAKSHFKLLKDLRSSINKYVSELNQSNAFWRLTFRAHLDATLIRLCRIYDDNKSALHLKNWLETIKSNRHLFRADNFKERLKGNPCVESLAANPRIPSDDELQSDIDSVKKENPLVKKLRGIRDNSVAHKNAKMSINGDVNKEILKIDMVELEGLINKGMEILNKYSSLFKGVFSLSSG